MAALVATMLGWWANAAEADYSGTKREYDSGQYAAAAEASAAAIAAGDDSEDWRILQIDALLAQGKYEDSLAAIEPGLEKHPHSVRLRWLSVQVYRLNGQSAAAERSLKRIDELYENERWRYRDPASHVTLGRYLLLRGFDAKTVLDKVFNEVKKRNPKFVDALLASGELALEKHDYQLALETYQEALKIDPHDGQAHYGLVRALAPTDTEQAQAALQVALDQNPNHVDCLLFVADQHIDSERYAEAEQILNRIRDVNPVHPLAWAYRAVLAHLRNEPLIHASSREHALRTWPMNPEVDHLIGRKLSEKYRFAEGAAHQRQALQLDPDYLPAKIQLAQDLLRLGQEQEGWALATQVNVKDGYDVVAHNLVTLKESVDRFVSLEGSGFIVRMDPREARIYGSQVLELLARARRDLCAKYEVQIAEPVLVEMFPRQEDFAIRTFGLPGGSGFLAVCFGRVITANSPASQTATPTNWQATLWHEFCHVVTLEKTHNKMPRWLSEGISVYEERVANPTWGQSMNATYREMILGNELTPVSQLSGAFLTPKTPLHLQFAYYESSLVVEYLVGKYGLQTLQKLLVDLGVGMPINDALARFAGSLELLDREFAAYARQKAEQLAPQAEWAAPELPPGTSATVLQAWLQDHPRSWPGLRRYARQLLEERRWDESLGPLEQLLELEPGDVGAGNAYSMLATAYRELQNPAREREVLERLVSRSADDVPACLRLIELCSAANDWPGMLASAERLLAVNPLQPAAHRALATAAEQQGDAGRAMAAYRALLEMDPLDPAELHYRLAIQLEQAGDLSGAKQQLLESLEETPRFRAAHARLRAIVQRLGGKSSEPGPPQRTPATDPADAGRTKEEP